MRTRSALPATVAGVALLMSACSSDSTSRATSPAPTTAATAATAATPTVAPTGGSTGADGTATSGAGIRIAGFKFGPPELDIAVGDTVTWTNGDKQAHTATSSGTFDTGSIAPGSTATATFDTAGTFAYICSFHPFMKGTIVVE